MSWFEPVKHAPPPVESKPLPRCAYCGDEFEPSKYHPEQKYCRRDHKDRTSSIRVLAKLSRIRNTNRRMICKQ